MSFVFEIINNKNYINFNFEINSNENEKISFIFNHQTYKILINNKKNENIFNKNNHIIYNNNKKNIFSFYFMNNKQIFCYFNNNKEFSHSFKNNFYNEILNVILFNNFKGKVNFFYGNFLISNNNENLNQFKNIHNFIVQNLIEEKKIPDLNFINFLNQTDFIKNSLLNFIFSPILYYSKTFKKKIFFNNENNKKKIKKIKIMKIIIKLLKKIFFVLLILMITFGLNFQMELNKILIIFFIK